jgi:two-component system KDP operon response regulator KdpE
MNEMPAPAPKVLIISNQQTTGPLWVFSLQQQRMNVVLEANPKNALQRSESEAPDLIVLDINIAPLDTVQLIKSLRAELITPIILLTPHGEDMLLEAYNAGVDDCMLKPVSPSLFQAKIKVWLRRSWSDSTSTLDPIRVNGLQLVPGERMLIMDNGRAVRLTNLELRLLYYLMNKPELTIPIEELNQRVWGYSGEGDNTMLKNVVYRLRRKIEADPAEPRIIQTVVGVGYKLLGNS